MSFANEGKSGYSTLHELLVLLEGSLDLLGRRMPAVQQEQLCVLVQEAMSTPERRYHVLDHVFDVARGADPILVLAALFHDVVYWQVDRASNPEVRRAFGPLILDESGTCRLGGPSPELQLLYDVFGFAPGMELVPASGLNEFLSARVAQVLLQPFLQPWELTQILACIEASIPFRDPSLAGSALLDRLQNLAASQGADEDQVKEAIRRAIDFAHRDLASFASSDVSVFLTDSWTLMSETNPALRHDTYRVSEYRAALQKVHAFCASLDPARIFPRVGSYPEPGALRSLETVARRNLEVGVEYVRTKLLAVAFLEALAAESGGDAPLVLFTGKESRPQEQSVFERMLNASGETGFVEDELSRLLNVGRAGDSNFDLRRSPLASYLYSVLPAEARLRLGKETDRFLSGAMNAREFVAVWPSAIRERVIRVVAQIAWTRSSQLSALIRSTV